jgi:hypothetical protein
MNSDNSIDILNEYKDQVRILKGQINELEDAGKSKDAANKRCLQKLEFCTKDLDDALSKIKLLEEKKKMWISAIKLAINAGSHIYKKKQETRMNIASAQAIHAEKMATGELEYKAKVIESNDNGWKDEFVLLLVSLPILLLVWSIFSDDPEIRIKLDLFFEYFKQLPYWYQAIFIGVVSAIYGLKGADIMRKPK